MAFFQTDNLRVERDGDGVALIMDVAGRSLNVFTRQVLTDLEAALDRLAAEPALRLLGVRSADPAKSFAGADVQGFAAIRSADEARDLSQLGQRVFDKLADLPFPSVITVGGPCLGGGLELALACDYRLVIDHPKTQFGLPEVELGLLPGWGGTQRLPRVVGLERALQIILGGRRLDAREARQWGLADGIAANGQEADGELRRLAQQALSQGKRPRPGLPMLNARQRVLESNPVGRWLIFRGTERILRRRVPDDMPAPFEALRAVRTGLSQGMAAGLAYEREAAGRLATSPACRNLVGLFLQREAARKLPAELRELHVEPVRRVGVVGAGAMGAGIAQLAAFRGCEVVVQEINETALGAGLLKIAGLFKKAVERRLLTQEEAEQRLAKVRGTNTWKGFDEVEVVVEAIVEDLAVKQKVFRELEARTKPATVLATNTSSLSVARLQEGLEHPERVAGLHFFNPVHKMPLVEVVEAPRTDRRSLALLLGWSVALGKTPVPVKDSPGFVVNRVLMPYLSEAVLLLVQKMPVAGIDKLMRRFGMPMGPLELLDQIGLDVAAHVAGAFKPAPGDPTAGYAAAVGHLFQQLSQRGWLGQKSGSGFYVYRGRRRRPHRAAAQLLQGIDLRNYGLETFSWLPPQPGEARDRLVLPMVNAAAACVGEGLTERPEQVDLAMVLGTGWAPHRGGPLHYGDARGLPEVVRVLQGLAQRLGPWFEPCAELRRRAESGQRFCPEISPFSGEPKATA